MSQTPMSEEPNLAVPATKPEDGNGITYWRSFDQLEERPEHQELIAREFAEGADQAPDPVSRRDFLSVVAASAALAGMTSCRKPKTEILPFNTRPAGYTPGIPHNYATTFSHGGYGIGVLVKSNDGRPTKIEGNPDHPSSLGGSDARQQAELLLLYDPDRSNHAIGPDTGEEKAEESKGHGGGAAPQPNAVYESFYAFWEDRAKALRLSDKGSGLHFLMPQTTSPSLQAMIGKVKDAFAKASFHRWEPIHNDEALAGAKAAFGKPVAQHVNFEEAHVIASFDCDFLQLDGNNLRSARQWAKGRKAPKPDADLSRLYMFESCFSTTGTAADERFRMRSRDVAKEVLHLAAALDVATGAPRPDVMPAHITELAKDLQAAQGKCAVLVGPRMPAAVHAVGHAINQKLKSGAVSYTALPASLDQSAVAGITALKTAIEGGQVETLVCLGANPVYDAPADLGFGALLGGETKKVEQLIHLGLYQDETGQLADWHFPLAHELETWGDCRAHDGTVSMQQPLVEPLYGGLSELELLAFLSQQPNYENLVQNRDATYGYDLLQEHWRTASGATDFRSWWRKAVHDGQVADTQLAAESVSIDSARVAAAVGQLTMPEGFEVNLRPCPKMWGGRFANNSWMQELPDPLTKLCWDNAALLSMKTAKRLGIQNGDLLTFAADGGSRTLEVAAWILPGHADDCATINLGWGRKLPENCRVANGTGFDAYQLRTAGSQWHVATTEPVNTGKPYLLTCTQEHGTMVGRPLVREATTTEYRQDPRWAPMMSPLAQAAKLKGETEEGLNNSLWQERGYLDGDGALDPEVSRSPYQWGMVIDLNTCTGCSACVVACTAENNIPMVGKRQVARNREMFWLRADRYFTADPEDNLEVGENPKVANMPVPCMQCENAPCESVCPVGATMHSPDGLNDMAYNRCIGTRYCSNNCPYKVRRFNYLNYLGDVPDTKRMAFNPDVTVRSRGVMEKCTYCVQRINGGRITAKLQDRMVGDADGDVHVEPACAQSCPTGAITFGNIKETSSHVATLRSSDLNYGLLSEMNTKPRTTYLGRVRNPNENLAGGQG